MKINRQSCTNCADCIPFCPGKAIFQDALGKVDVNEALCFECGVCSRSVPCPTLSFIPSAETYGRRLRAFFSNPYLAHDKTLVPGRGTEEVKTNDVTHRYKDGEVGLCIEFGRPIPGCTFTDISIITSFIVAKGLAIEPNNPLSHLLDQTLGKFPPEIQNERILSAILEVKCSESEFEVIAPDLCRLINSLNITVSLGLILCNPQLKEALINRITCKSNLAVLNAKGNYGLGQTLYSEL